MLSGYVGSGKDTVGNALEGYQRLAFADTLKEDCSKIYNIDITYFYDREKKDKMYEEIGMKPRELLIMHATQKRKEDIHYFVRIVYEKIEKDKNYVITDCRFHNELWFMKKRFKNMKSVWIKRNDYDKGIDSIEVIEEDCDIVIDNSKSPFNKDIIKILNF